MTSNPSLEPYLRARSVDPTLIPSMTPRGIRKAHPQVQTQETDFTDFLHGLVNLAVSPWVSFLLLYACASATCS